MKRAFDLTLVVLSAPLWVPVLVLTACAVRACMGKPVFFRQERAGLRGRPFCLCKFRSMREGEGTDAERLTRFGRTLRGRRWTSCRSSETSSGARCRSSGRVKA